MAQKILIMGESGTGKSTSLRNLNPATTAVVNPVGKPLPFKGQGKFTMLNNETKSSNIVSWIRGQAKDGKKIIIVDDFQYLLSIPYMNRIHENGWDKWNDFGGDYFSIIDVCGELPADVRVYYLSHCETLDNGITTIKLIGKLLREKITIEGLFTIVLRTSVIDGEYFFLTQNSGKDTVKSPMGMFDEYAVVNDLSYIDDKICNYYEIGAYKSDAEIAEADKANAGQVTKPDASGRRSRSGSKEAAKVKTADTDKTKEEVEAENKAKMDKYLADRDKAVSEAFPDQEEVPFEEASAVADTVPKPELEEVPRRKRGAVTSVDKGTGAIVGENPLEGNMNPPEKAERRKRGEKPVENGADFIPNQGLEQPKPRTRRVRNNKPDEGFMNVPDDDSEELPFN